MNTPNASMPMPDEANARRFPTGGQALLLYLLFTLALTAPLALHMNTRVPLGNNDMFQNLWNLWWWDKALTELHQSPYATNLQYQPGATSLAFHTHSEGNLLTALPAHWWLGPAFASNFTLLVGFLLSGWGAYFLAREVCGDRRAAFLAGLVYAFFPHRLEQSLEHVNLASVQAMPFFLLFLLKIIHQGGRTNIALCGAFFALNTLYSLHYGLIVLPAGVLIAMHGWWRTTRPRSRVVVDLLLAGLVATLILVPFLWPRLREMLAGETYYLKPAVKKGIDPAFLFIPPEQHSFWGGLVAPLYAKWRGYGSVGFTCYVGWGAIVLAVMGLRRTGPASILATHPIQRAFSPLLWASLAAGYLVVAVGSPLTTFGHSWELSTPFDAIREIPLFATLRVANRFVVPVMLIAAVLAACGAARFLLRLPERRRRIAWFGLVALLCVDFLWVPFPLRELPNPAWTAKLREMQPGLVWNIPGGYRARAAEDLYLQTLHGQPLVGGYTSCVPPHVERRVKELPFLQLVFHGLPDVKVDVPGGLRQVVDALPIQAIVFHRQRIKENLIQLRREHAGTPEMRLYNFHRGMPAATLKEIRAALDALWGPPTYEDEDVAIFVRG